MRNLLLTIPCILFIACTGDHSSQKLPDQVYDVALTQLTDEEYPDNPDIELRDSRGLSFSHSKIRIEQLGGGKVNMMILPGNNASDTIRMSNVDISELIPTIPSRLKDDEYLSLVAVVNQEWNRHQVKFDTSQFTIGKTGDEHNITSRLDLARNCLNSGLWEVITFSGDDGNYAPLYHGWFNFPNKFYADLFREKNNIEFSTYADHLEQWKVFENKRMELGLLRIVDSESKLPFVTANHEFYPLIGERQKKFKNILFPKKPETIDQFLSDSTRFATFTPPGIYSKKDPRKTELSLLKNLDNIYLRHIKVNDIPLFEIDCYFSNDDSKSKITRLLVGGLSKEMIPVLPVEKNFMAMEMPMGIANHTFYESYDWAVHNKTEINPCYGLLLTEDGKWLDSHRIGIDGPAMHFDQDNPNLLHLWILSFERHAMVGHYILDMAGAP